MAGPWRLGTDTGQGHRSDLAQLATKIREGTTLLDIASEFPASFIRYHRGIERLVELTGPRRRIEWQIEVIVYHGTPGSGKTHAAKESWPDAYEWMPQRGQTIWWNGYRGEETILIDEFASNFQYHYALQILNNPGVRVETKGGCVNLYAKRIVLTSMDSPTKWWPSITENRYALYRRISECYIFEGNAIQGTATRRCDTFPLEFEHAEGYPTRARLWIPRAPECPSIEELRRPCENLVRRGEERLEEELDLFW